MIRGINSELAVYIDDVKLSTENSRRLRNHAPDGLVAWGYHGSGPSQLALELLLHFGATDSEALTWYQDFKRDVIARLANSDFEMPTSKVSEWIEARRLFSKEFPDATE